MRYVMKLTRTHRVCVCVCVLGGQKWISGWVLSDNEMQWEWQPTHIHTNLPTHILMTQSWFCRSDGVLFESTFAEMDAANRARHHIGIIGL